MAPTPTEVQAKADKKGAAPASTWSGTFEVQNNFNQQLTNVTVMHRCKDTGADTVTRDILNNNTSIGATNFETASGDTDYWYVSFLDENSDLWTAHLSLDYHESESNSGTVVEISINPQIFIVTIGKSSKNTTYDQNDSL